MRTTSTWFEAKLDRVLAEAGTKMTDSMMVFIDGATNELWNHWDKFKEGIDPKSNNINPFPNPPWEYNGPTETIDNYLTAIIISPDNIKFGVGIVPSSVGTSAGLFYPGGVGYEDWDEKQWGLMNAQTATGTIAIDPRHATSKEELRQSITHEVAHIIDQKERRIEGSGAKRHREHEERNKPNPWDIDYQRQSHEIDAIMASLADRRLREIITPDSTPADIQNAIRNIQPKHKLEHNLLKHGQWKRYLQTIYRFAQQRQQND